MQIANIDAFIMLILSVLVFGFVFYRSLILGKLPTLRMLPGVEAMDEGIKRAVEMGKSVFIGFPATTTTDPSTLQTVTIINDLARKVAKNAVKGVYGSSAPDFIPLMTGAVRDGYVAEGKLEDFNNPQMCKILALLGGSSGFATGLYNLIREENVGTAISLGYQHINAHAIGEICQAANVFSVIGHPNTHVNLGLIPCAYDYSLILNEYYAAGAFLGKDPVQLGSVRGMDIITYGLIIAFIVAPILFFGLGLG